MSDTSLKPGDRVLLRDRPWRVLKVTSAGDHRHFIELEALDGGEPTDLSAVIPPDEVSPLPSEAVLFDLAGLDSLAAWSRAHLILGATLVRETGIISGARFGRVALEAYQIAPTLRLLAKPRPSLLVADDVGLGKTIEAGLAMLELMARGRAPRILIIVPPGLIDQWRDELHDKFGLEFTVIENAAGLSRIQTELPAGVVPWDALPRVITSMFYVKKETVRSRALRKHWDLVVVDEAHALAESGTPESPYRTQLTRLGLALREAGRGLLLLTATPHHGHSHSFRSLLDLVEPTLATLGDSPEQVQRRIETARIRRMKPKIRRRSPDGREQVVFPKRDVQGIEVTHLTAGENEILHKVATYCARTTRGAADTEDAELVILLDDGPGFDAVLGKPPLDKVLPARKDFYVRYDVLLRVLTGNDLDGRIHEPHTLHPGQDERFREYTARTKTLAALLRKGGDFPLSKARSATAHADVLDHPIACRPRRRASPRRRRSSPGGRLRCGGVGGRRRGLGGGSGTRSSQGRSGGGAEPDPMHADCGGLDTRDDGDFSGCQKASAHAMTLLMSASIV